MDSPPRRGSPRSICRDHAADPGTPRRSVAARVMPRARGPRERRAAAQQVVVAAVRARPDERLVERQPLARHLVGRKGVAGTEGLRDHRHARRPGRASRRSRSRASHPGAKRGTAGRSCPSRDTTPCVTSSGAKMPFSASASAIMFAIVFRYAIGSCRSASTSSTDMPCDCRAPHRRSSSSTMSLPLDPRLQPAVETRRVAPSAA